MDLDIQFVDCFVSGVVFISDEVEEEGVVGVQEGSHECLL